MKFELPKEQSSIIKVIGVGGGGSNAVNHMYQLGIKGVDFIVCNTDHQALDISPVPVKIQLGKSLTEGRGAGAIPDVGMNAAIENIDDIQEILNNNTKMVFVTAGMGGGTGTGAAPVIAAAARELGILTVGIVTVPFGFEGRKRRTQAEDGIEKMREAVDTLLVINNEKLREMYGNLTLGNAFAQADDVLSSAAKGIAEVISVTGQINVDFNDVNTVMKDSGVAIMGTAEAEGENRALKAVEDALSSPLLNDNQIHGARYVLLNITYGAQEVLMDEIAEITDFIQDEAGNTADVIWGHGYDETLGDKLCVTIIATGFQSTPDTGIAQREPEKKKMHLDDERPTMITEPIQSPTQTQMPVNETPVVEDTTTVEEEPFIKKYTLEEDAEEEITSQVSTPEETTNYSVEETESTTSWEFSVANKNETSEDEVNRDEDGKVRFMLEEDVEDEVETEAKTTPVSQPSYEEKPSYDDNVQEPSLEEVRARAQERLNKIREASDRMRTPSGLTEMEKEPAYKRRKINLDDVQHSSESNISRFTLGDIEGEDGEKRTGLSDNNSFLHDNVD